MPNPTSAAPFTYRDVIGTRHRVVVHKRADDAWQVLDIAVIETLTGDGEGRDAAEALARDYAQQHHHRRAGSRGPAQSRGVTTHSPPAPGGRTGERTGRAVHDIAGERSRPPGGLRCRVRLDDGRRSAASCRQSATGRCISDCCTPSRTGWSSSPPAPDATGNFTSTRVRVPTTSCPAAAPARPDGSRRCSRSRPYTRIAARSCSSHPRSARRRAARSTPSRTPARCGSTSTSPDSYITCGRSSPRRPATCLVESGGGGAHAYWLLDKPLPATDAGPALGLEGRADRARARADHPPPRRRSCTAGRTSPTPLAEIAADSCA